MANCVKFLLNYIIRVLVGLNSICAVGCKPDLAFTIYTIYNRDYYTSICQYTKSDNLDCIIFKY